MLASMISQMQFHEIKFLSVKFCNFLKIPQIIKLIDKYSQKFAQIWKFVLKFKMY